MFCYQEAQRRAIALSRKYHDTRLIVSDGSFYEVLEPSDLVSFDIPSCQIVSAYECGMYAGNPMIGLWDMPCPRIRT
jgi:hypothetical protein